MSLLDSVLGGLMGGQSGSPMMGVLSGLLGGGGQQQQGGMLGGLMGGQQPQQGGMGGMMGGGGLAGLLGQFQNAGLGNIAQSWVGSGPNMPVSPQQLQSVFGEQQVNSMAGQAGMQPHDFLSQLAQHLPNAVDGMTPGGRLPEQSVSV